MNAINRLALPALAMSAVLGIRSSYASLATYQTAVSAEPSLISYYQFDAGSAADSKGTNNGTEAGTVSYANGVGNGTDKALMLSGSGHIDLGEVADFDFSTGLGTVEAWVRADWTTIGFNPAIFADRDGGAVNWSVHMNSDKGAVGLWNGVSYEPISLPAKAGTAWHHIAVVFGFNPETVENTFTIYWDGKEAGHTSQWLGISPEAPTEIGSSAVAGAELWKGAIDEVAFYSDALSADAIKAHYTAFLAGDPPVILTQPSGGTFLSGVPLTLSVEAKGADLSYQWSKNGSAIAGETNVTLTLPALAQSDAGSYIVTVSNLAGQIASSTAEIALGTLPTKVKRYQDAVRAESSLISYYTFDTVNAADSSGANNGSLQGSMRFDSGIGGAADKAAVFDGSSHINLGAVDAFNFASGSGTVEAWVRADWTNPPGYNPTLFADRDGGPVNWSVHMNQGKDAAGVWNGTTYEPRPTQGTGTSWHHLAVVFDSSSGSPVCSIYWDGTLSGTTTQPLGIDPEAPTEIGSVSVAGGERWIGAMDEVAFYSEALTPDAIQAHYSAFVQGDPPVITAQPIGGSFFAGAPVTLSVGAQGLDLQYQWSKDGTPIPGATASTYSIPGVDASTAGLYKVKVTNASGSAESSSASIVLIAPNLPGYRAAVLGESSLVSLYTFDSGDATDSKGSNNGSPVDTPSYGPGVGGGGDQALLLDGSGHIDLGPVDAFNFSSGQGSVEAWIRADWADSPGYNPAIFADRDGGPVNWSIHMNSGKEAAGLWNGSSYTALPIANTGSSWHHLAAVFGTNDSGGAAFTLYWDGEAVGTTGQALGPNPESPTELGSSALIGAERWVGALDEVAFYNSSLSPDTVRQHYQAFIGGGSPAAPSIQVSISSGKITLSWPGDASGYILESSANIPAATWTAVPGVTGSAITLDANSAAAFYRLRKQP
jgi:hypothetical protein